MNTRINKKLLDVNIFSSAYWKEAARELANTHSLVFAAIIIALRVVLKMYRIPLAETGLNITFDAYVNAVGAMVYGPVVAILAAMVSDTLGCIIAPSGAYFFPFILVEIGSSLIFALFLWRKNITVPKVILSKFFINLICNIIITSVFMKWQYFLLGDPKFATYNIINGVRIVKNLIMFPIEACLIAIVITALLPALKSLNAVPKSQTAIKLNRKNVIMIFILTALSIGLVLFYVFFFKEFMSAHNFKFF